MSKEKKLKKQLKKEELRLEELKKPKVKMRFSRSQFYNDPKVPLYDAGKVYEIEPRMVSRWLKRGGEIVEDLPKVQEPVEEVQEPVESSVEKSEYGEELDL